MKKNEKPDNSVLVIILALFAVVLLGVAFYIGANIVRGLKDSSGNMGIISEETEESTQQTDSTASFVPSNTGESIPQVESTASVEDSALSEGNKVPKSQPAPKVSVPDEAEPESVVDPLEELLKELSEESSEEESSEEESSESESSEESSEESKPAGGNDSSYVISNSDSAYLSADTLKNMSSSDLRLARNEILARHGRRFNDSSLQAYFDSKSWYKGTIDPDSFDYGVLNDYESANIDLIKEEEGRRN